MGSTDAIVPLIAEADDPVIEDSEHQALGAVSSSSTRARRVARACCCFMLPLRTDESARKLEPGPDGPTVTADPDACPRRGGRPLFLPAGRAGHPASRTP